MQETPTTKEKGPIEIRITARILAFISIAIIVGATFLPFMTFDLVLVKTSFTLWDEEFKVFTIVGMVILAINVIDLLLSTKHVGRNTFIVGCLIGLATYIQYTSHTEELLSLNHMVKIDLSSILLPGPGLYLVLLGAGGLIISGIWMARSR